MYSLKFEYSVHTDIWNQFPRVRIDISIYFIFAMNNNFDHQIIVKDDRFLRYQHEVKCTKIIIQIFYFYKNFTSYQRFWGGVPQNFGRVCCSIGPPKTMFYCIPLNYIGTAQI